MHGRAWIGDPLESALGSHCVEAPVRLAESDGVADRKANATRSCARTPAGERDHLCRGIDADDLAIRAEILGKGESRLAEPTAHIEEPLAINEMQTLLFPLAQLARRVPPCVCIHRGDEYRDIRIVVDPLVPEAMSVPNAHVRML